MNSTGENCKTGLVTDNALECTKKLVQKVIARQRYFEFTINMKDQEHKCLLLYSYIDFFYKFKLCNAQKTYFFFECYSHLTVQAHSIAQEIPKVIILMSSD